MKFSVFRQILDVLSAATENFRCFCHVHNAVRIEKGLQVGPYHGIVNVEKSLVFEDCL